MKKIVVIDGQGGRIGAQLISELRCEIEKSQKTIFAEITAVGTNSLATAAMLKSAPDNGATGENPVVVACKDADILIGPIGITVADSLYGEVTPKMAVAVGQSPARRLLIPVNKCDSEVIGAGSFTLGELISATVKRVLELL